MPLSYEEFKKQQTGKTIKPGIMSFDEFKNRGKETATTAQKNIPNVAKINLDVTKALKGVSFTPEKPDFSDYTSVIQQKGKKLVDFVAGEDTMLNQLGKTWKEGVKNIVALPKQEDPKQILKDTGKELGAGFKSLGQGLLDTIKIQVPKAVYTAISAIAESEPHIYLPTGVGIKKVDIPQTKWSKDINKRVASWSNGVIEYLDQEQKRKLTELGFTGEESIFDARSFGYNLGTGAGSMALAIGTTIATKNPMIAAGMLGWLEGSDTYNESKRLLAIDHPEWTQDQIEEKALVNATVDSVGIALLEKLGIDALFRSYAGGKLYKMSVNSLTESAQEGTQTVWSNLVAKYGYDDARKVFDGLGETLIVTMPIGFFGGAITGDIDTDTQILEPVIEKVAGDTGADKEDVEEAATELVDQMRKDSESVANGTIEKEVNAVRQTLASDTKKILEKDGDDVAVKKLLENEDVPIKSKEQAKAFLDSIKKSEEDQDDVLQAIKQAAEVVERGKVAVGTKTEESTGTAQKQDSETQDAVNEVLDQLQDSEEAQNDWEDNYAEDYAEIVQQLKEIEKQIRETKDKEEKSKLQTAADQLDGELGAMSDEFVEKYQVKAEKEVKAREQKLWRDQYAEDYNALVQKLDNLEQAMQDTKNEAERTRIADEMLEIGEKQLEMEQEFADRAQKEVEQQVVEATERAREEARKFVEETKEDPLRKEFEAWAKEQGAEKILTYADGESYFVRNGVEVSMRDFVATKGEGQKGGAFDAQQRAYNAMTPKQLVQEYIKGDTTPTETRAELWAETNLMSDKYIKRFLKEFRQQAKVKDAPTDTVAKLEQELRDVYSKVDQEKFNEAVSNTLRALDLAEAGQRIQNKDGEFVGIPSTFPQWIPEKSRTKNAVNVLTQAINDLSSFAYPTKKNARVQREFFDAFYEQLDYALDVDTSIIRHKILYEYGEKDTKEPGPLEKSSGKSDAEIEQLWADDRRKETKEKEVVAIDITKDKQDNKVYGDTTGNGEGLPHISEDRPIEIREMDSIVNGVRENDEGPSVDSAGAGLVGTRSDDELVKLGKKGRQTVNEQVVSLLTDKKYSTNPQDYTSEELLLLEMYTGSGGKESVGAEGKGLLSEYYTPAPLVNRVWEIAQAYSTIPVQTAYEPSAGTGRFISYSPENVAIDGAELSEVSGTIAKILNQNSDIEIGKDFQENFYKKDSWKEYDVLIGNPPFGDRSGLLKGRGEEKDINRWEEYFIKRGLDMTKEGGVVAYVVNSSFLDKQKSKGKTAIAELGELVGAYRLPENIFEDTTIGTDIVVFRKEPTQNAGVITERITTMSGTEYFKNNETHVLGRKEMRKNRFGKDEEYVTGTLDNALSQIDTLISSVSYEVTPPIEQPIRKQRKPRKETPKKEVAGEPAVETMKKQANRKGKKPTQVIVPDKVSASIKTDKISVVTSQNNEHTQLEIDLVKRIDRNGVIQDITQEEILEAGDVVAYDPGVGYMHRVNYYAGNVEQRIERLTSNKKDAIEKVGEDGYKKQLEKLQSIIPQKLKIDDVEFDPLDRHVANMLTENGIKVINGFTRYVSNMRGTMPMGIYSSDISRYAENRPFRKGANKMKADIIEVTNRLFNRYLREVLDKTTQDEIMSQYNTEKNSFVDPDFSQYPVTVSTIAKQFRNRDFAFTETQKNGIKFLVNKGSGLIAYGVGVGKTHTLMSATIANMDAGRAKRPLFVVPQSTISKTWIATIRAMFPNRTIVNLDGLQKDVVARLTKERGSDYSKWINDGEIAVISHSGILRLGLGTDDFTAVAADLADALWTEAKTKRGEEKEKDSIQEILGEATKYSSDILVSDLGIDHLSVDEVHNFRKVFQGAKAEKDAPGNKKRFANVIGGTPSMRAKMLFVLSQYIQRKTGGNVFLASATPFENHATEVYNILSFIARDRMKEMGIYNINDFFAAYSSFKPEIEVSLDGKVRTVEKMKKFKNLKQLQALLREFIDYRIDKTLVRPERMVSTPILPMSSKQMENVERIQNLLAGIDYDPTSGEMSKGEKEDGAFLKASTYTIANSVSPYFIEEYYPDAKEISAKQLVEDSPKIDFAIQTIKLLSEHRKTMNYGTFMYLGKFGVAHHEKIKEYIVANTKYSADQVGIINGTTPVDVRENIKEGFNAGVIKVLIGGDPTKEGIDLQKNGFAMINLALGWNPTEPVQVEGRVWRQGNKRSHALIIYPLIENSGDSMIYAKFDEKGSRINDLFSYIGNVFDVSEVDPEERKLATMTNPEHKAEIELILLAKETDNKRNALNEEVKTVENQIEKRALAVRDMTSFEESLTRFEQYKKDGKNAWGDIAQDESQKETVEQRIKQYKKDIAAQKGVIERIDAQFASKNITDVNKFLEETRKELADMEVKLANIKEEKPRLVEKYKKQREEEIKNRKSPAEHSEAIVKHATENLRELSDKEIEEIRERLIAAENEETGIKLAKTYGGMTTHDQWSRAMGNILTEKELDAFLLYRDSLRNGFDITKQVEKDLESAYKKYQKFLDERVEDIMKLAELEKKPFDMSEDTGKKIMEALFDENELDFLFNKGIIEVRGYEAWGVYKPARSFRNPLIELATYKGRVSSVVTYHESFHAYMDLFVTKEERTELLERVRNSKILKEPLKKIKSQGYTEEQVAEEWLADDFGRYAAQKQGYMLENRKFYEKILDKVQEWIRKLVGAQAMYDRILAKERPNDTFIPSRAYRGAEARVYERDAQGKFTVKKYAGFDQDGAQEVADEINALWESEDVFSINVSDTELGWDYDQAVEDIKNGIVSYSDELPILVRKHNGKYVVIDGNHRLAQFVENGATRVQVTANEERYNRIMSKTEDVDAQAVAFSLVGKDRGLGSIGQFGWFKKELDTERTKAFQKMRSADFVDLSVSKVRRDINTLENLTAQARDIYLKDPNEFEAADDYQMVADERREKKATLDQYFTDLIKPYMVGITRSQQEKVNVILMQGDMDAVDYTDAELRNKNLNAEEIKAYKAVRKAFDIAHQYLIAEMRKNDVPEDEIAEFERQRVGYMPHKWKYKEVVKHQVKKKDGKWYTYQMDNYKSKRQASNEYEKLRAKNVREDVRYVLDTLENLEVDFFSEQHLSFEAMKSIVTQARTAEEVKQQMLNSMRDMVKEKGFGRHYMKRTGTRGYETNEVPKLIADYFSGMNGYITKMEAGKKYYKILNNIDARRQKNFYGWMRDMIAYEMGHTKEWQMARTLAFTYYLANDISFLVTNATQNFTVGLGELSKYMTGAQKIVGPEVALMKALKDWNTNNVTAEEKKAIESLVNIGRLGGEMTSELMGFKNNPLYQEISNTFSKVMYTSTAFVEMNVNRIPMYLAAYRLFIEQGMSVQLANERALEVSDDIHFRYGKQNRPRFERGHVGVLFVFYHYMRSLMFQLYRDATKGEYIAFSRKMFYTTLLGGTVSLPFAQTLLTIFTEVFNHGCQEGDGEACEMSVEMGMWEQALKKGVPSLTGIDLSGRVGIDIISVQSILQNPMDLKSYIGAVGNLGVRFNKAIQLTAQQRYADALGKALPDMIANPINAWQGYTVGVRSFAGTPLEGADGEAFKYNSWEAIIKATGFTPTRENVAWDAKSKQFVRDEQVQAERSEIRRTILGMVQRGEYEEAQKLQNEKKADGTLSETTNYMREFGKETFMKDALKEWKSGAETRARLTAIEKDLIQMVYGDNASDIQKLNIRKEFAVYRTFGLNNELVEALENVNTNKEKVEVLLKAKETLSEEDMLDFLKRGRKTVRTEAGNESYILISDDLLDMYKKAIK